MFDSINPLNGTLLGCTLQAQRAATDWFFTTYVEAYDSVFVPCTGLASQMCLAPKGNR